MYGKNYDYPNHPLFKLNFAEIFRTVEVGIGAADGVPADKVRNGHIVAALVEVGAHLPAGYGEGLGMPFPKYVYLNQE